MRRSVATLVVVALVGSGCGSDDGTIDVDRREADIAEVMALSLVRLVTVDTTFGPNHLFTEVLVLSSTDPQAGSGTATAGSRALSESERSAIEKGLSAVGPMRWIDDADEFRTPDLMPIVAGSAIVGVGEPTFDAEGALVPVSLWCGGVCGTWFTYRLVLENDIWRVVGPEGPVAIS